MCVITRRWVPRGFGLVSLLSGAATGAVCARVREIIAAANVCVGLIAAGRAGLFEGCLGLLRGVRL